MTRLLVALIAALTLATAGMGAALWHVRGQNAVLHERNADLAEAVKRAESARKRATQALGRLAAENAATARGTAVKQGSLAAAVAASAPAAAWAAQPVPEEVRNALAGR